MIPCNPNPTTGPGRTAARTANTTNPTRKRGLSRATQAQTIAKPAHASPAITADNRLAPTCPPCSTKLVVNFCHANEADHSLGAPCNPVFQIKLKIGTTLSSPTTPTTPNAIGQRAPPNRNSL